jgi:hypothetical protein
MSVWKLHDNCGHCSHDPSICSLYIYKVSSSILLHVHFLFFVFLFLEGGSVRSSVCISRFTPAN